MDAISFLGPRIPLEVKKLLPLLQSWSPPLLEKILLSVLQHLQSEFTEEDFDNLARELKVDRPSLSTAFTGIYLLLRGAIRSRFKIEVIQKDLLDLRIPQHFAEAMVKVLKKYNEELESSLLSKKLKNPTLEDMRWRVDVTISTQSMSRVLKPTILMELTTSEGKKKTFEMTVEMFHKLRYNTAKVLKDMEELEKHPILKI